MVHTVLAIVAFSIIVVVWGLTQHNAPQRPDSCGSCTACNGNPADPDECEIEGQK